MAKSSLKNSLLVKRIKIFLYPSLSLLLLIFGFISIVYSGGYISESSRIRSELKIAYNAELQSSSNRQQLEIAMQNETRFIERHSLMLVTIILATGAAVTFMVLGTIEIINDADYNYRRRTAAADKYARKLRELNSEKPPMPRPSSSAPIFVPSGDYPPAAPKPSGRPIIRSSASAGKPLPVPPKSAPPRPVAAPLTRPVASPPPPPPPPPPPREEEFPHEFPEIEPEYVESGDEYFEELY